MSQISGTLTPPKGVHPPPQPPSVIRLTCAFLRKTAQLPHRRPLPWTTPGRVWSSRSLQTFNNNNLLHTCLCAEVHTVDILIHSHRVLIHSFTCAFLRRSGQLQCLWPPHRTLPGRVGLALAQSFNNTNNKRCVAVPVYTCTVADCTSWKTDQEVKGWIVFQRMKDAVWRGLEEGRCIRGPK